MAVLTTTSLTAFVVEEIGRLEPPTGPERRSGAVERAPNMLRIVRRDLRGIGRLLDAGRLSPDDALSQLSDLVLELTSLLYSAGAPHPVWRRWSGIYALGQRLQGHEPEAAKYAALGGEWALLEALADRPPRTKRVSELISWCVLRGQPSSIAAAARDEEDEAWLQLGASIAARDDSMTARALETIAQHWLGEGDWRAFHPRSAPDFEPAVCAVAALARRNGFTGQGLSADAREFLEPGLATAEPASLWPDEFSDLPHANGSVREQACLSS
jgi:hypothetical protein